MNVTITPTSAEIDELVWKLGQRLRAGKISRDEWGHGFVRSILKQNKRRNWMPSERQLSAMQKLVAELAEPDAGPLIDDGGSDDWAA